MAAIPPAHVVDYRCALEPVFSGMQPKTLIRSAAAALAALGALSVIAGLTADWSYAGQLCRHWSAHAAIAMLPGLWAFGRRPAWGVVMLLIITAGVRPWLAPAFAARAPAASGTSITVATANVLSRNQRRAEAIDRACAASPNLLCLPEVMPVDRDGLRNDPRWPHQVWASRISGLALLSSRAYRFQKIHPNDGNPFIEVVVDLDGRQVRVLAVHAASPRNVHDTRERNQELLRFAVLVTQDDKPALLLGDFNDTVADPNWTRFCAAAQVLRPAGSEPASWPSFLGPFGITIDHVVVRRLAVDPPTAVWLPGSDHRGLLTRVSLLPGDQPPASGQPLRTANGGSGAGPEWKTASFRTSAPESSETDVASGIPSSNTLTPERLSDRCER